MRQLKLFVLVVLLSAGQSGCSLFPESMQPWQLWKYNRNPGPSVDPFFNVPDPIGSQWKIPPKKDAADLQTGEEVTLSRS